MQNQHVDNTETVTEARDEARAEAVEPAPTELEDEELELAEAEPEELAEPEDEDLETLEARMGELTPTPTTTDSVRSYLQEIGKVKLLTLEEEISLARRYEEGKAAELRLTAEGETLPERTKRGLMRVVEDGELAKDQLTEANLRLVVSVAKKYRNRGWPQFHGHGARGEPGAHPGGGEVRVPPRLQVFHLRHLVDPAGYQPGDCRSGAHHPHSGPYGRDGQQVEPHAARVASGLITRPVVCRAR